MSNEKILIRDLDVYDTLVDRMGNELTVIEIFENKASIKVAGPNGFTGIMTQREIDCEIIGMGY